MGRQGLAALTSSWGRQGLTALPLHNQPGSVPYAACLVQTSTVWRRLITVWRRLPTVWRRLLPVSKLVSSCGINLKVLGSLVGARSFPLSWFHMSNPGHTHKPNLCNRSSCTATCVPDLSNSEYPTHLNSLGDHPKEVT